MPLSVDLPYAVEQALQERARRNGQGVAELAAALLTQAACLHGSSVAPATQADQAGRLAALARIGSYDTRARAGLPPLSDEAIAGASTKRFFAPWRLTSLRYDL